MAERNIFEETSLGSGEEALRNLITSSNGSSVIARYIHVDRNRRGINYKHAFIITEVQNLDDDYSDETVLITRLGIVHYGLKRWEESLKQYINPFNVPSYGAVKKAELVVHRKFNQNGSFETMFADDPTNLLQDCFDGKFSLVTHPDFPQTVDDKRAAAARAESDEFIREDAYSIASRNCQHLITEILLGEAKSPDAEKNKFVACILDSLSQSCGRLVGRLPFIRYRLENLGKPVLKLLQTSCIRPSGFLNGLLSSVGDDVAENIGRFFNLLADQHLTPLQTVLKDAQFALLFEFLLYCVQTTSLVWQHYKGKKRSKEIAPVLIKGFMAALGGSGGATAGSALAMLVFGCASGGFAVIICQALGALICHAFGMWFGSLFCGGKIERFTISILDKLRVILVTTGQTAERIKQGACDYFNQLLDWITTAVDRYQAGMRQLLAS